MTYSSHPLLQCNCVLRNKSDFIWEIYTMKHFTTCIMREGSKKGLMRLSVRVKWSFTNELDHIICKIIMVVSSKGSFLNMLTMKKGLQSLR